MNNGLLSLRLAFHSIFNTYRLVSLIQIASLLWIDLLVLLFFVTQTLQGSWSHHLLIGIAWPMLHANMHVYVQVYKIQCAGAVV